MSKILYPLIHSNLTVPLKYWFYKKSIVINEPLEIGSINSDTGKNLANANTIRTKGYIDVSASRFWTLSRKYDRSNMKTRYYDVNKNYLGYNPLVGTALSKTLEMPDNTHYIRFTIDRQTDLSYFTKYTVCLIDAEQHENLPSAYQELEYIESDGTQYIDLGLILTNETDYRLKLAITRETTTIDRIFGAYTASKRYELSKYANTQEILMNYLENVVYSGYIAELNKPFIVEKKGLNFLAGDKKVELPEGTFETTRNAYLMSSNRGNIYRFIGKMYYLKIYENSTLTKNFIPAKRISDNVLGVYDTIAETFLPMLQVEI